MSIKKHLRKYLAVVAVITLLSMILGVTVFAAAAPEQVQSAREPFHKDTPAQSIQKIQAINQDFLKDGKTQPTFTYNSANNAETNTATIREEVWIEVPCDTDENGTRDMVRAQITRPAETGVIINAQTGETKVSVPALMLHSPYNNTVTTRPIPLWNVWKDLQVNPDTTDLSYFQNIQTQKPRSPQWAWSLDASYWNTAEKKWATDTEFGKPEANASWYVTPRLGATSAAWFIPASRGEREVVFRGNWPVSLSNPGATYQYFYTRGYAIVTSASIGNDFLETGWEGYNNTGNVEETLACMAIIKWLNGDPGVKGYTDRNATKEVVATWCNGNVAMTGTSYDGTLPEATACSGVDGLKAILPVAAISSWYDYYRGNGAVIAPHGWQGEDADYLAARCFSQSVIPTIYQAYLNTMTVDKQRETGDYNTFWDDRNYLTTVDSVRADCGIMVMHGLNDYNVKAKHADQFYRALKDHNKIVKEVWHLGAHAVDWNKADSYYMNFFHQWMDRFLYLVDNNAENTIPEVSIPSNNSVSWEFFDKWPIAGSTPTKFYFSAASESKAGSLQAAAPAAASLGTFKDDRVANAAVTTEYTTDPTVTDYNRSGIVSNQIAGWEDRLFNPTVIDALSTERLAFATEPLAEPLRINGTVTVGLEASADIGWGTLSAALVEVGPNYRAFSTSSAGSIPAVNGTAAIALNNYTINNTLSQYKIVARGHVDLQNPNPAQTETYLNAKAERGYIPDYYYKTQVITPGTNYKYYFEMEPMDYTFKAGTRLALYVYSADYRDTQISKVVVPTFTLLGGGGSFVELPIVPTYSIFYDANGGNDPFAAIGGYSDAYAKAGQSSKAPVAGYRVVDASVARYTYTGFPFQGWNTKADGTGTAYAAGARIADSEFTGNITLYAQWEGDPHKVEFIGFDGHTVLATQTVANGGLIDQTQIPVVDAGEWKEVKGWMLQESGNPYDLKTPVTGNLKLMPLVGDKLYLRLKTDAHMVKVGDYFRVTPYFIEEIKSNTAVMSFVFDPAKFEYRGFTPADGVTVLNTIVSTGTVQMTFMVDDYKSLEYGQVLFSAKDDADLKNEDNEITVAGQYVALMADGSKVIKSEVASTLFTTWIGEPGPVTLITLSNLIDVFGMTSDDPRWPDFRFYDYNNNKEIDILDIAELASKIVI